MHAAGKESRLADARAVPRRRAEAGAARVTEHAAIHAREQLQVDHAVRELVETRQAGSELRRIEVVQHADAQDQIVLLPQPHAIERIDRAEADVAARAEAADRVLARVDAGVLNAWPGTPERLEPVRLSAPDVEDGAQGSAEDVLGC